MKKIFFLILFWVSAAGAFAQLDSSKIRIGGIIIKGKICDNILYFVKYNPGSFPLMDSVFKVKYLNPPSNNTDVTIDSVNNKEWLKMWRMFNTDVISLRENWDKDLKDELNLHGTTWIKQRILKDTQGSTNIMGTDEEGNARRKEGQKYGKKENDEVVN